MKQFKHVEDYLEVISGIRDPNGVVSSAWMFSFQPLINLARYDVKVLESMTLTTFDKKPLTERQGELACKIILKYERQLAAKGVDVEPVRQPNWRVPLRKMDYSKSLTLKDNQLVVKFPYETALINGIKDFQKESQGSLAFNRDEKIWIAGLTEYNLSWLHTWAKSSNFEIDEAVNNLMNLITAAEQQPYAIELFVDDDYQLNIRNAPDSLREYIVTNLGGFGIDNLLKLIDYSSILGYTVEPALAEAIIKDRGPRFYNLAANRELKVNPTTIANTDNLETIIDYAIKMNRFVVIYEPDLSGRMLAKLKDKYPGLLYSNGQVQRPDKIEKPIIHTVVPITNIDSIPLLVSSAGMMFGGDKQFMLQRAEKVVYCTVDVYNKKTTNQKVKNLAG